MTREEIRVVVGGLDRQTRYGRTEWDKEIARETLRLFRAMTVDIYIDVVDAIIELDKDDLDRERKAVSGG